MKGFWRPPLKRGQDCVREAAPLDKEVSWVGKAQNLVQSPLKKENYQSLDCGSVTSVSLQGRYKPTWE